MYSIQSSMIKFKALSYPFNNPRISLPPTNLTLIYFSSRGAKIIMESLYMVICSYF